MMKRFIFLLCVALCLTGFTAALADTVTLTSVVPAEHSIVVNVGEHGSVSYGNQSYSETASVAVERFGSVSFTIVPDFGYELDSVRVSSGENVQVVGTELRISSVAEDLTVELSFGKSPDPIEWEAPVYVWAEDYSSVTATRAARNYPDQVETETVAATGKITTPATCTAKGKTTYTSAAFENPAFAVQTKTVADIPALKHAWQPVDYSWAEDYTTVTATRICSRDSSHIQQEVAETTFALALAPTQTQKGKTTYTAVFKNTAFSKMVMTVADIPALNALNVLTLPASLKGIDAEAFMGLPCEAVIIPEGCTTIGSKAFADCTELIYIRIPASVTSIADDAFEGTSSVRIDKAN